MRTYSVKKGRRVPKQSVTGSNPVGATPSSENLEVDREWRDVVGFPPYEVSNLGEVRRNGRVLKQFPVRREKDPARRLYRAIQFSVNGKVTQKTVHSVVAAAFIGPRPAGLEIDHIDGDDANNRADNLEYVTPAENTQRAYDLQRKRYGATTQFAKAALLRTLAELGMTPSQADAYVRAADDIHAVAKRVRELGFAALAEDIAKAVVR